MVAAALIGGSLVGAGASIYSSNRAANTQANAANNASSTQLQMFNQMRGDLSPYTTAGTTSLGALQSYMGIGPNGTMDPNAPGVKPFTAADLPSDPGYQFRLQQGQNAILNARSAMGGVNSGATLKDLTSFAQGTASDEFNQAWQRYNTQQQQTFGNLFGVTGLGESAAAGVGAAGIQTGSAIGANTVGAGNAQAAGTVAAGNAVNSGVSNIYQQWMLGQLLSGGSLPGAGPG